MNELVILLLSQDDKNFVFNVRIQNHTYKVRLSREYYKKLTAGNVEPEELIRKSFDFLLEREPASSILPEFDLPLIGHYFPEYEEAIKDRLD
jgi:hypothetical protein